MCCVVGKHPTSVLGLFVCVCVLAASFHELSRLIEQTHSSAVRLNYDLLEQIYGPLVLRLKYDLFAEIYRPLVLRLNYNLFGEINGLLVLRLKFIDLLFSD